MQSTKSNGKSQVGVSAVSTNGSTTTNATEKLLPRFFLIKVFILVSLLMVELLWTFACFVPDIREEYKKAWFNWMNVTYWNLLLIFYLALQTVRLVSVFITLHHFLMGFTVLTFISLVYIVVKAAISKVPIYLFDILLIMAILIFMILHLMDHFAIHRRSKLQRASAGKQPTTMIMKMTNPWVSMASKQKICPITGRPVVPYGGGWVGLYNPLRSPHTPSKISSPVLTDSQISGRSTRTSSSKTSCLLSIQKTVTAEIVSSDK